MSSTEEIALKTAKEGKFTAPSHQCKCSFEKGKKGSVKVKTRYEQKLTRSTFKDAAKEQMITDEANVNIDAD